MTVNFLLCICLLLQFCVSQATKYDPGNFGMNENELSVAQNDKQFDQKPADSLGNGDGQDQQQTQGGGHKHVQNSMISRSNLTGKQGAMRPTDVAIQNIRKRQNAGQQQTQENKRTTTDDVKSGNNGGKVQTTDGFDENQNALPHQQEEDNEMLGGYFASRRFGVCGR